MGWNFPNLPEDPPADALFLPLCLILIFLLKLQELKTGCFLLPLGLVQLRGQRNFLFLVLLFCNKAFHRKDAVAG